MLREKKGKKKYKKAKGLKLLKIKSCSKHRKLFEKLSKYETIIVFFTF